MENALKKMDKEWWRFDEKLKYKGSNESTEYVKKPYKQQVQLFFVKKWTKDQWSSCDSIPNYEASTK